jgi:hypothetical protein
MEKIKIKVKIDQLEILNGLVNSFDPSYTDKVKQIKAMISVLNLVSKRLRKLEITKEYVLKPFVIKFHYHEAYFLQNIINHNLHLYKQNPYEFNVLLSINLELDKQLV